MGWQRQPPLRDTSHGDAFCLAPASRSRPVPGAEVSGPLVTRRFRSDRRRAVAAVARDVVQDDDGIVPGSVEIELGDVTTRLPGAGGVGQTVGKLLRATPPDVSCGRDDTRQVT